MPPGSAHERLTGRRDGIKIAYIPTPDQLRAAGTFGTHWMMPPQVPFGVPTGKGEH